MKRAIWITLLAVLAFAAIIIIRLPASWVLPAPPSAVACIEVDGTVWSGTCTGLTDHGQSIGDLSWQMHAVRLLAGKLNANVLLTRPSANVRAVVEVGLDKNVVARDVQADLSLDPTLLPQLPPDLRGTVHAEIALLVLDGRVIKTLQGQIEAHNLEVGTGGGSQPLGSYSLTFPGGSGDPVGRLRDLGGPLAVEGSLRLTPEPGFDLQSLVAARPDAPEGLQREIQFLGSPDAQGRRPFAFAASF
jgi:general secretion pathway protein N